MNFYAVACCLLFPATVLGSLQDLIAKVKRDVSGVAPGEHCGFKGDIIFLMDASSSLKAQDYIISKDFIKSMIGEFDVGSDKVRIGMGCFNRFAKPTFQLDQIYKEYDNVTALQDLVENAMPTQTGTFTNRGLAMITNSMFSEENGDRPDVPNVVIVITDGRSRKPLETAREAMRLRQTGAVIYAIAVGRWQNDEQLQMLASRPTEDYRFSVKNYGQLIPNVKKKLTKAVCETLENPPEPVPECIKRADLLFVIDASSSIQAPDFEMAKTFVAELLDSFIVSPDFLKVAAMTFDSLPRPTFYFDEYQTSYEVKQAIFNVSQVTTGTFINRAFVTAGTEVFNPLRGDRLDAPNVIIMLTDGRATKPKQAVEQSRVLKDLGTTIVIIGIGTVDKKGLEALASSNPITGEKMAFVVDDFNEMEKETNGLVNAACSVEEENQATCQSKLDIMFVVDITRSAEKYVEMMRDLVAMIADGFNLGANNTQIGLITFNQEARLSLKLWEGVDMDSIEAAFDSLPDFKSGTMTWKALNLLRTQAFMVENGGRSDASKVAVILSEGVSESENKTIAAAEALKDAGVKTFLLTVNAVRESEVNAIASSPAKDHFFGAKQFMHLFSFVQKLRRNVCGGLSNDVKNGLY